MRRGRDYNSSKFHKIFPELWFFAIFGHFKLVSKISSRLFELGA